ncbi:sensor domain-containing diguanylate cyclase [Methylomonas sp. ZR1]|uniref:sensor domain-containing diguanylate cyclase n=1 Tax=unclassified Methylomonas TaxID=2608980 RepID=UPI001490F0F8|nr:sensor domain-containing diguanylate cyclase [Methylomonas sp. ZR1]NOV29155.1 sensor domain-containing diguanylate cyclase [Methylomonas sp. ZR1]
MNQPSANSQDVKLAGFGVQDLLIDLVNALSAVKQLSEIDCQVDDEKTLIRQALASLIQYQDMERCSFFIVDSEGLLSNVAGISVGELGAPEVNMDSPLRFRVGEGLIGAAAATGVLQHCQNCHEDKRFEKTGNSKQSPGSIISVPVFTFNRTLIGVLNVSHPQAYYFNDWHIRLLEVYKNILGQLITTRRLVQHMEQQIASRTAELESLVAETNQLKDHFASMSMHDQLTGLHNRRFFYDQVEVVIAHHKRYKTGFCLLVMDIDHFKVINDRFGHLFGDQVLTGVAKALKRQVRNTDILVRFGGEEFVAIFTNTRCDSGKTFAERIRQEIKTLEWSINQEVVNLTLSIGIYCLNSDLIQSEQAPDIDQMINYADAALYQAKASGRDKTIVFGEACSDQL